ncbi:hypothetical protein A5642_00615 [Mycolicibacterium mucogenicum]|uniref:HTH lacI-type domain-containing protein n=1 Tax=Mycolicibacterium mucogenicum TaxID=56689 RepID=A0A1A0N5I1_MYCMU|nr:MULTISPECIES: LacI family DNA-binding transcriptional regulator [Mycobacteriaceae]MDO3014660.1 LacI family DNA-binding transcriptional regulator [Mycobacteroides abscessus subsp. abscessus]OBA93019.1 hypothetical protein A5642_00615 [Mycolicibacterium mucogenicum]
MASSRDVALRAGVSRSTVSQIMNGHEHRFTADTVARVREVAEGIGYRPSAAARTLARGTSDIVITLVPNITFGPRLREFIDVFSGELEREGYTHLLRLATSGEGFDDALLSLRPHAVVSLAPIDEVDRRRLERHGVLVVEQPAAVQERLDIAIGQRQARHLAARGYRAVAAAVPVDLREQRFSAPRAAGVHDWSLRNGVQLLPTLQIDLASGGAVKAVSSLPPDAVIGIAAYNDEVALAVLGAAQRLGRNVPAELGVIGADNSLIAQLTTPTITTIDFDLEFSARYMVQLIITGQDALEPSAAIEVTSRLRLIAGDSTARLPEGTVLPAPDDWQ